MGTPDRFSTEVLEHQHIESKQARRASNKVRPTLQMIKFLQRYGALRIHRARMDAYLGRSIHEGRKRRKLRVVLEEDEDALHHRSWQPTSSRRSEMDVGNDGGDGNGDGESDGVNMGSNVNGREQPDEAEEGEGEDQQHHPGRMRTAAEARQHVVYPSPMLSIVPAGRVRGLDVIAKYGAVNFVPALHAYLNVHGTRRLLSNFLPTAYHEYPVWHRLYLRHDALLFNPKWPRRDVIRAHPESQDRDSAFDVALYLQDKEQLGIHRKFEL
ncbi:hypothetical protein FRC08_004510 [Ceratobasidium sp. 394]|nr:hypothetical protein FRC08_004510 [Ceratobasidium sp. 394]